MFEVIYGIAGEAPVFREQCAEAVYRHIPIENILIIIIVVHGHGLGVALIVNGHFHDKFLCGFGILTGVGLNGHVDYHACGGVHLQIYKIALVRIPADTVAVGKDALIPVLIPLPLLKLHYKVSFALKA